MWDELPGRAADTGRYLIPHRPRPKHGSPATSTIYPPSKWPKVRSMLHAMLASEEEGIVNFLLCTCHVFYLLCLLLLYSDLLSRALSFSTLDPIMDGWFG